ncbi:hypothetical protein DTO164E3_8866 [Paecilomyces variotii]|nr:hypothetical protein DTO032I3_9020 [Paecilomyces variotii]KAJ9191358.1 hypothetical protein DTO164E3_8866 [Paecilomyces variotii]KAJ9275409.1 hypothetical protein DTO021D3_7705 [Paecilomyces variotii]KAJ9338343.1 hypothetical protein DTO027B6_9090 [Paecilomyces variotii]KAJ9348009.1 hypothetical protein DTO027B9_8652 [Paecilomyces variotii]
MGLGLRGVLVEEEDDADRDLPGFGAEGGVVGCSIGLKSSGYLCINERPSPRKFKPAFSFLRQLALNCVHSFPTIPLLAIYLAGPPSSQPPSTRPTLTRMKHGT